MDSLQLIVDWMKNTDLAELSYKKNGIGFSLNTATREGDAGLSASTLPPGRFTSVAAESVGIFQWSEPGKPRKADEGAIISEGDVLGVIVTGSGAAKPLLSPRAGRVSNLFVDAGAAVEFGQPILLIETL
ncbi:MAG: hypothetical protein AAB036_01055 [Elusimicrobiota bacterium]